MNEGSPGLDAHEVDVARFLWCYTPCLFSQSILKRNSCSSQRFRLAVDSSSRPLRRALSACAPSASLSACAAPFRCAVPRYACCNGCVPRHRAPGAGSSCRLTFLCTPAGVHLGRCRRCAAARGSVCLADGRGCGPARLAWRRLHALQNEPEEGQEDPQPRQRFPLQEGCSLPFRSRWPEEGRLEGGR